jgi:probable F420-dependent oxidoreductase
MDRTRRWGITLPLHGLPLADQRELVSALPVLGYTDAWSAELNGVDAFSPLVLASQWAPALRLGTAIAGIYSRAPVALAVSAGTLGALAPGRFVMGIGTSSKVAVEQWNGIPFEKPYQRSRDMLQFLRAALTGEKVSHKYETFSVHGFRLAFTTVEPPPVVLAALRPGMLRLAGREADGAITNWVAPQDIPRVATELAAGGPGKELIARLFVAPTPDADVARSVGRYAMASYLTVPVYRAFHEWLGREELMAPMQAAWAAGDRKGALEAIPDELVDTLVVHGAPQACKERIQAYVDQGVTTPVLALLPVGVDSATAVSALAPAS